MLDVRSYTWCAPGRGCMSRIDLALGNEKILPFSDINAQGGV